MTQEKREPFAAIPHRFNGWITVGPCSFLTMMSGDDLRGAVDSINAAFNARVDEEVRKAVEKFRERAEIVVRQECGGKCGGDRGCEISRKIMEIPTEPEVK